jgi:ATP-binding protein involved in chromosome partitioning
VTTPQEVAAADVRKAINMFEQVGVPLVGVVENMSYFVCPDCEARHEIFGRGAGEALADQFHTELLGRIPVGTSIRESGDAGKPIVLAEPDSEAARAFREIADAVARRVLSGESAKALPTIKM